MDVKFALDNEKLLGLKDNKAMIYFMNNNGGKPNLRHIGSAQGIDTFQLYEAWNKQCFMDNKVSVLVGLHDMNTEFKFTDLSNNFLMPTADTSQTLAQSGRNGPSTFPSTSLTARLKVLPTEGTYLLLAAFDGVPGNVNHRYGTHVDLQSKDGLLLMAEVGFTPKAPEGVDMVVNKFAVDAWSYTKSRDDLLDVDSNGDPVQRDQDGAYLISSYQLYHDKDKGRSLGGVLRAGIANGDTLQVDWDYMAGIVANGWVPTGPDSEIGVGFSQTHNGEKYNQANGVNIKDNEYVMELYYRDKITNGISVQPDVQYVAYPSVNTASKHAVAVGIRFDINF